MENLPEAESSLGFLQSKKNLLIVLAILFTGVGALAVRSTGSGVPGEEGEEEGRLPLWLLRLQLCWCLQTAPPL